MIDWLLSKTSRKQRRKKHNQMKYLDYICRNCGSKICKEFTEFEVMNKNCPTPHTNGGNVSLVLFQLQCKIQIRLKVNLCYLFY